MLKKSIPEICKDVLATNVVLSAYCLTITFIMTIK